jgi:hypothetical protein
MTVPIERAIDRNARMGLVEDLLRRVEVASAHRVSELRFSPRFHPGNVQLLPEDSDLIPVNLPHLVMKGMEAAMRQEGTISLDGLVAALRQAGYELGPRRRDDLEGILRQLYVSGSLEAMSGEASDDPSAAREQDLAMKMWWSR